jgi:hypothetical protein
METSQSLAACQLEKCTDSPTALSNFTVAQRPLHRVGSLQWSGLVAAVEAVVGALFCLHPEDCAADQLPSDTFAICSDDESQLSVDIPTLDWGHGEWPMQQELELQEVQQEFVLVTQPSF